MLDHWVMILFEMIRMSDFPAVGVVLLEEESDWRWTLRFSKAQVRSSD